MDVVLAVAAILAGLVVLEAGAERSGVAVPQGVTRVDLPHLLAASVLVVALFRRSSLHWRTGLALLALYAGYIAFALIRG